MSSSEPSGKSELYKRCLHLGFSQHLPFTRSSQRLGKSGAALHYFWNCSLLLLGTLFDVQLLWGGLFHWELVGKISGEEINLTKTLGTAALCFRGWCLIPNQTESLLSENSVGYWVAFTSSIHDVTRSMFTPIFCLVKWATGNYLESLNLPGSQGNVEPRGKPAIRSSLFYYKSPKMLLIQDKWS